VIRDPAGHTSNDTTFCTPVRPARRVRGLPRGKCCTGTRRRPRLAWRRGPRALLTTSGLLRCNAGGVGGVRALVLPRALRAPAFVTPLLLASLGILCRLGSLGRGLLGPASVRGGPARRRGCWLAHHHDRHMWTGLTPAGLSRAASSAHTRLAQGHLGENPETLACHAPTPGIVRVHPDVPPGTLV